MTFFIARLSLSTLGLEHQIKSFGRILKTLGRQSSMVRLWLLSLEKSLNFEHINALYVIVVDNFG